MLVRCVGRKNPLILDMFFKMLIVIYFKKTYNKHKTWVKINKIYLKIYIINLLSYPKQVNYVINFQELPCHRIVLCPCFLDWKQSFL
jgi:hypothetical protein